MLLYVFTFSDLFFKLRLVWKLSFYKILYIVIFLTSANYYFTFYFGRIFHETCQTYIHYYSFVWFSILLCHLCYLSFSMKNLWQKKREDVFSRFLPKQKERGGGIRRRSLVPTDIPVNINKLGKLSESHVRIVTLSL